jgi:UDP-4-amino-4-deoxy-L-arabinose formyltransferase / UDP-glucuronic acid dehydrogenase (UDP-4-keto-hexauronic acid decarboxylating)
MSIRHIRKKQVVNRVRRGRATSQAAWRRSDEVDGDEAAFATGDCLTGCPRVVFFGHGLVGRAGLRALFKMGLTPVVVFGHRPGPGDWQESLEASSRGMGIPFVEDADLASGETADMLNEYRPDVLVSVYFRQVIPDTLLRLSVHGGINLHGSLLPKYRGRAPVNWMLVKGETEGGASLHVMTRRPDRGPLLGQMSFSITSLDTGFSLLNKVAETGSELLSQCLPGWLAGSLVPVKQGPGGFTCGRRGPEDGLIDWTRPAREIRNLVRAVTRPYPGAFGFLDGRRVDVWWVEETDSPSLSPGEFAFQGRQLLVGTGTKTVILVDWCNPQGLSSP